MSSYGELIQALKVLKNVKEKRHGIKTLASLCSNRAFQVRIVQRGGWRDAILPLIISLDEDCRKYAALAIANLSTSTAAHQQLLEEDALRHLVPILHSEEVQEIVTYVLNALGNFACSPIMWPQMQKMNTIEGVASFLVHETDREDTLLNVLFCLANFTADAYHRQWMMAKKTYELVWKMMQHPNYHIMQYSLTVLRGLAVETSAQQIFPKMGLVPLLIGIFQSQSPQLLRTLVLEILLHFSFLPGNADMLLQRTVMQAIESAARGENNVEYVPMGIAIIANLCENVDLHVTIVESPLFEVLTSLIQNDSTPIQQEVIRALMLLSLSPKYHHVILTTGVMANVCPIAMTERLPVEMRCNALQMMGAVCATHPTAPTESDIMDLLFLCCNNNEDLEVRRASMMVIANASSDKANTTNLLRKPFIESLVITLSKAQDVVLVDYLMQFFHNVCKLDSKAGGMMIRCGYQHAMFTYDRLESLSVTAAIYLCDTCRQLAEDSVVRSHLMQEMIFKTIIDAWVVYLEDPKLAPHMALMASAFTYHSDSHQEFVLQGGVRLVIDIYGRSQVEHVRMCCLLSTLYLAESKYAQRSIAQERGMQTLLSACENETHIDLVTNALKALIPFASSDDYRPELGMDGGLDTFSSFIFSSEVTLQQLAIHLLQNLLELRANRRIFLGLAEEKRCEEDYLEPLVKFLPDVSKGPPKRIVKMNKGPKGEKKKGDENEVSLTPHDPFIVRSCIHSLALLSLEHSVEVQQRFIDLQVPQKLFNLFYSEQIDKSSGEAVLLFFANILHSDKTMQGNIMRGIEVIPMMLVAKEMDFSTHTNTRCLSALLCISRCPDYRRMVVGQLDLIMTSVNGNLAAPHRDEDFYSTAAVHCALLCELARVSHDLHPRMAKAGVVEAFLVFITIAGRGLKDEICVELLMSAVFGIAALVASPTSGEQCMTSLLFPGTRLQLFMSLLRLPSGDVNNTFHLGTVGVRTLQRAADPGITDEELYVDLCDVHTFLDQCAVRPAAFMYRNVIRTLGLLLAHPGMRRRVQEAISPSNIIPTCLFALRGAEDYYVQVFGYLLVANFSGDETLRHGFVCDTVIINELLNTCRRFSPERAEDRDESVVQMLAAMGAGGTPWTAKSVQLNKYMLAMIALTNFTESVKEVYRQGAEGEDPPDGQEAKGQLTTSNKAFVAKFAALCLRDVDCDSLLQKNRLNQTQEFATLLKVVVVHNAFVSRIELENEQKGGEVKVEPIGVSDSFVPERPKGLALIPQELRVVFKKLVDMQRKCDSMLEIVDRCLEMNIAKPLVKAVIECLGGLTFVSPMCISKANDVFKVIRMCPEWLQSSLCALFANCTGDILRTEQQEEAGDPAALINQKSDHLFPLISTATLETRQRMVGALANISTKNDLMAFVMQSGVFRIVKPIQDKAFFIEHFGLLLECTRMLCNMVCREDTHELICTEKVMAFLRDMLIHSFRMLEGALTSQGPRREPLYEEFEITFEEDDVPPLGLRIRWETPAQVIEVLPDTPASRLSIELMEGDELIDVNGIDVSEKEQHEIAPMFESRPLLLGFRRRVDTPPDQTQGKQVFPTVEVEKISAYGNREQYLECFHLTLLTLHNFATSGTNHEKLLAEPKILATLIELIPSDAVSPSLRRLTFSTLTCLAQQRDVSQRVFRKMSEYFQSVQNPDSSLQKFIMLCANLFYTSLKPEEVEPDRSMLVFIGRLASLETAASSNVALIEVLHGMARAPRELRKPFVCRETMVVTIDFVELKDQYDVQLRAFESAYFLTVGACDPVLWASLDIIPRMARAAAGVQNAAGGDKEVVKRGDGLFEIVMRIADLCLEHSVLVQTMTQAPDLDRYLMDLFVSFDKSASWSLWKVAAHLMSGLLQSDIAGPIWQRWRSMGFTDKIVQWFTKHKDQLDEPIGQHREELSLGTCVDMVLHMLLHAIDVDAGIIAALVSQDVVTCISKRIIGHVNYFKKYVGQHDTDGADMAAANVSFRNIAQLMTALMTNEQGLTVLSALRLEEHLVSLLALPAEDFRAPALIMLSSLASHKVSCQALARSNKFMTVLQQVQVTLQEPGSAILQEELEYLVTILDRTCCFPELTDIVKDKLFRLLCLLPTRAETVNTKLMGLRALSRCSFVDPGCTDGLQSVGLSCLHYIMAANNCLKNAVDPKDEKKKVDDMDALARRKMMSGIAEIASTHEAEANLIVHFSRAILCETVLASRGSCVMMFRDLDPSAMLDDLVAKFDAAHHQIENGHVKLEVAAGDLMNCVLTLLHVLLCVVFRQNTAKGSEDESVPDDDVPVDALVGALGVLERYLDLSNAQGPQGKVAGQLGEALTDDIRVSFFVSALLHEAGAKPLSSKFVRVVRSRNYFKVLQGTIRVANRRLQRLIKGPPPKDLFVGQSRGGVSPSPLAHHISEYDLPQIFEHLTVCLRHSLVQAMYVEPTPATDDPADPWLWSNQERHAIHASALKWIPSVLKRYPNNMAIRMEVVRYIAAAGTFYEAPYASPQATPPAEGEAEATKEVPFLVTDTFSLVEPSVMEILTHELETSKDPYIWTLAGLSVSNLAGYEQQHRMAVKPAHDLSMEELSRMITAMFDNLRRIESFPQDLGIDFVCYGYRTICNLLAFDSIPVTCMLMGLNALEVFNTTFDFFFRDVHKIDDDSKFTLILRTSVLLLRNWCTAGGAAEREVTLLETSGANTAVKKYLKGWAATLQQNLQLPPLLNLLAKVVSKVTDQARKIPDEDAVRDGIFHDVLAVLRTVLHRSDTQGKVDWKKLNLNDIENMVQVIKEHRYKRTQLFEDEEILNILYLLTKQAYTYHRLYFPDYLMEVAYGHREEHTLLQDMAAICCAIITTQNSKDKSSPTCNVANVVKDNAAFIHSLQKVPDPRMQLWHYRLITQWSQKPHVLDDVSNDAKALKFVADTLLDPILGRYSMVILHNISVLRSQRVLPAGEHLATVCKAYRSLTPAESDDDIEARTDEEQRRMLRRLLIATARNCLQGSSELDKELGDADFLALIDLADAIEAPDVPIFFGILLMICEGCDPKRTSTAMPGHAKLVKIIVKQVYAMAQPEKGNGSVNDSPLYDILPMQLSNQRQTPAEKTRRGSTVSTKTLQDMTLTGTPMSPSGAAESRGLGKKPSLYQMRRRPQAPTMQTETTVKKPGGSTVISKASLDRRSDEQEFVYFAALEILSYTTFREASNEEVLKGPDAYLEGMDEEWVRPPVRSGDEKVRDALDKVFDENPMEEWMKAVAHQVSLHESQRIMLSDLFMTVTTKFLWHCWSHPDFRIHFNAPSTVETLSKLVPFFLSWTGSEDVCQLMGEVCLYAGMHQYTVVTDFLVEKHVEHVELAVSLLTRAMVDEETSLKPWNVARFLTVLVELIRGRNLNRPGLHRLAVGVETCLLKDHPQGIAAYLAQKEHKLLGELLEQLYTYNESGSVKQSMVVTLALTAGQYYKSSPELDEFVLRILDIAAPLLEDEFVLFFPVLHRFASKGGVRTRAPLLARNLHHRVARLLEKSVHQVEMEIEEGKQEWNKGVDTTAASTSGVKKPFLTARQKVQWTLALFSSLAGAPEAEASQGLKHGATGQDLHFDSFVCVDLLPILVRILRADPQVFEAVSTCFLLSSVARSPCIEPHMPDVLRLAEQCFPGLIKPITDAQMAQLAGTGEGWEPLVFPAPQTARIAMRRSFLHLLATAGFTPRSSPALLGSPKVFKYLAELQNDPDLFEDPSAVLHAKLYCLANLCTRGVEAQQALMEMHVLELFETTYAEVAQEVAATDGGPTTAPDLRVPWVHCLTSLMKVSGARLLGEAKAVDLFNNTIKFAEEILQENLHFRGQPKGLSVAFESQQALAAAIGGLSSKLDFGPLRQSYTLFLLGLICSAPLQSLRLVACDHLCDVLLKGYKPEIPGAVFLKTPCLDSFCRIITGNMDDLATGVGRVLVAFAEKGGYSVFVHMLPILETVVQILGSPSVSSGRILQLAELFMTLAKERTLEVIDALVDLDNISRFLGLARSNQASRRDLVQRWLEAFGSSFYEIDEVYEVFEVSTLHGLLHLAARSTLEPQEAQDLRRLIFGSVHKRIETWRTSLFGATEFCTESLISSLIPVCELQPDLVAAVVALFHSFITKGERLLMERIWSGGHLPWLCKRMTAKSRAQLYAAAAVGGPQPSNAAIAKSWEKHTDLIAAQGMVLHVIWQLYDLHPVELSTKAVNGNLFVSNWNEFLTYYCQHAWPLRETKPVEEATDATFILAMQLMARLARDLNSDMQAKLIKQGVVSLCMTVMLPNPQDQKAMRDELDQDALGKEMSEAASDTSEASTLLHAKLVAGAISAWLLKLPDVHAYMSERRVIPTCVMMFEQLYHWRKALFEQEGSVSVVASVGFPERFATLYAVLLSRLTLDWSLEQLELGRMSALNPVFLELWSHHGNPVLQHHCLRMVSSYSQVHVLYTALMANDTSAEWMGSAVHRTFGVWDVRELRHVMRVLIASLSFALKIPVVPGNTNMTVQEFMQKRANCEMLRQVLARGGTMQADQAANKRLLTNKNLTHVLGWCENPGDPYGRAWALWIATTLFAHEEKPPAEGERRKKKDEPEPDPDSVLAFAAEVNERHLRRRAAIRQQQQAVGVKKGEELDPNAIAIGKEAEPPKCRMAWLRASPSLCTILARIAGKAVSISWKESTQIGCVATARCLVELPQFLHTAVETVDGNAIVRCLNQPDFAVNLVALQLVSILSSFRLSLKAQNIAGEFLGRFHELQEIVIEGLVAAGEGPYEMMARWLHAPAAGLPCESEFRCLVAFMLGQCILPPLATAPTLEADSGGKPGESQAPPVAECEPPPVNLLDYLAQQTLQEDQRLKDAQVDGKGPAFSTMLCHLMYALSVLVPLHPKAAANSAVVRGAAFMQLMKVQKMVAQSVQPPALMDPTDGKQQKLFLYARATACIRSALQSITGSWLAADFGARFAVSEEGGRDFIQYCTKHINQAYNNKTVLTKVLGTPWERVMLSQGPTQTIAELLMIVCSTDTNLVEVKSLGGEQALHALSRFGETTQVKQQATMLLTKLAVMNC